MKSATGKTVRASTPYPPVLEPGIEEIGWLFGALKVQGLTTELGNADLTDTQIPSATIRSRTALSVGILSRESARNLPHPRSDLCTLERG